MKTVPFLINAKIAAIILNQHETTAKLKIKQVKEKLDKVGYDITLEEFCTFYKLPVDQAREYLKNC